MNNEELNNDKMAKFKLETKFTFMNLVKLDMRTILDRFSLQEYKYLLESTEPDENNVVANALVAQLNYCHFNEHFEFCSVIHKYLVHHQYIVLEEDDSVDETSE